MMNDLLQIPVQFEPETTPQIAQPDADVSGTWTPSAGGDMFAVLDEEQRDTSDYVESSESPSSDTFEVGLGDVTDPAVGFGHVLHYWYEKPTGSERRIDLTVKLMEGVTEIASATHTDIPAGETGAQLFLTEAEANNITDYTNLRVQIVANEVIV